MKHEEEIPKSLGEAAPPSLLFVGPGRLLGDPPANTCTRLLHCASGAAALRVAADPRLAGAVEVVFATARLADMTGTGLLDRMAGLLPSAARVLLVADEEGGEQAAAPPSALVTDVWTTPSDAAALLDRFARERRMLRRLHALQAQLDELHGAIDTLRARYLEARRARDHLVDSVGAGGSRWWQDYRQLTALRETGSPVHRRTVQAASLEAELLRVGVDLVPGALGREFAVQADPALLREVLERLCAGMRRHGRPGGRPRAHCRVDGGTVQLELSAQLVRSCDAAALLDPLVALEGGPVEGAPLDLPLAEALAEVHGTGLRLSVLGGELRARLALRRCEGAPRRREGAPAQESCPILK